jgi:serine/threonine protein phosphatase PrpC
VPDAMIAERVGTLPPIEACEALIESALEAGAPDNVSVGVFRMVNAGEQNEELARDSAGTTRRLELAGESTSQSSARTRELKVAH